MLKHLKLSNYILAKEIELDFDNGLNIFSGETGAGKSVIVEAINTVLGGYVRNGMLFDKEKKAVIEIVFSIDNNNAELQNLIRENGIDINDNEISFTKVINPDLKVVSYINGIRSTNSVIKKFRNLFIDFHSQRDQQKLFDNDYQLEIIDAFGNTGKIKDVFQELYLSYRDKLKKYQSLVRQEKINKDKFDLYTYQLDEIKNGGITENEDIELEEEYHLMSHAEELQNLYQQYNEFCFERDDSIFDKINGFLALLEEFKADNPRLNSASSLLQDCLANLDETASELDQLSRSIDLDPQRLEEVSQRIDFLNSLKTKYNRSLTEIIEYKEEIAKFIRKYASGKEELKTLEAELKKDLKILKEAGEKLSIVRKKAAVSFSKKMRTDIRQLSMPAAEVDVIFETLAEKDDDYFAKINENGNDQVEFYFSANKGKELQALKSAASGGEQSRFLLAVKKLLAEHLSSRTIVFDEIDSGIGGKTAELTGEYIYDISKYHQVVCITHLAQIAVFGDCQFLISKEIDNNISQIRVKKLDNKQKTLEIARMLSGSESELAQKHAEELRNKINRR